MAEEQGQSPSKAASCPKLLHPAWRFTGQGALIQPDSLALRQAKQDSSCQPVQHGAVQGRLHGMDAHRPAPREGSYGRLGGLHGHVPRPAVRRGCILHQRDGPQPCRASTTACAARAVLRASPAASTGKAFKLALHWKGASTSVARPPAPSSRPKHCLRNAPAEAFWGHHLPWPAPCPAPHPPETQKAPVHVAEREPSTW